MCHTSDGANEHAPDQQAEAELQRVLYAAADEQFDQKPADKEAAHDTSTIQTQLKFLSSHA